MRKLTKRLSSLLLCAAMLFSLCPTALAEESISYLDENGDVQTCLSAIPVTDSVTEWIDNWYVADQNVNVEIHSRVNVEGDVHLILKNGCALTVYGGINMSQGNSLTIYAQTTGEVEMGILNAIADSNNMAGIGGSVRGGGSYSDCGTVVINGGKVTADGGANSAGIGGSYGGDGGKITISGGEVTATSMGSGAGIGGGARGDGTIIISGGTVEATGEYGGAGIGGGGGAGGNITINGGEVKATGNEYGIYSRNDVTISGGTVTASGSGSMRGYGIYSGSTVTISDGTVKASGSGGMNGYGIYSGSTIAITGGTVTASGSGQYYGYGIYSNTSVAISGGTVKASGSSQYSGYGIYSNRSVAISGGTVIAEGTNDGISGTFSTGTKGSAFIVASSIQDQSGKANGSWSGVIFEGNSGNVYGSEITLATDAEIPADSTLKIEVGQTLIIGEDVTLTNNGIIDNQGTIENWGTIDGKGTIDGNAIVVHEADESWKYDGSSHWHPCAVTDCTKNYQFDKKSHQFSEWTVDKPADATAAGSKYRTCKTCGYKQTESIPPTHSHSYGREWVSDDVGHWHECSCGDRSGYDVHTPGSAATCSAQAICSVCGEPYGSVNSSSHAGGTEIRDRREATTSAEAYTGDTYCLGCGEKIAVGTTIPKLNNGGGGGGGTYTPPTYKPDVSKPGEGGGTPSTSPSNPKQGDTVTVKPKPDGGYEVDTITVTDRNGKPVEVTKKPDGTYTFKQPNGKVTIEVSYKAIEKPWNNPFTDVSEGDWYYEAVRFVQERGLMNGYSDGRFGPNDNLSRAQLAQILFNKEGRPGVNYLLTFSDVAGEAWYTEAIRWATSQGIVGGYGNGTFGPNDPITREQLAVMLWRYSGSPAATNKELHFNDTDEISGFALEALRWAVENGILNGYGNGRLGPQGQATRAQVAQMLKNFIENQEDDEIQ